MLNFEGFNESCGKILDNRTQLRFHWLAYAISFDLLGDYKNAQKVLDLMEKADIPVQDSPLSKYEASEVLLYRNTLLEVQGEFEQCLEHLLNIESAIKDKTAWIEIKARLLLKIKRYSDSESIYLNLLEINSDNDEYVEGWQSSLLKGEAVNANNREKLIESLLVLKSKYPRSHVLIKRTLNNLEGEEFSDLLLEYLVSMFRKGVPSSFSLISSLMKSENKRQLVCQVAESIYKQLLTNNNIREGGEREYPTVFLWASSFLAHLYDYQQKFTEAIRIIELAIEKTPTCVELHMFHARIYKHAGDYQMAMKAMDHARSLDLQDRFMNSKCTKYMLRNNDVDAAATTVALFSRDNSPTDPNQDLIDMQAIWYAYGAGMAYSRKKKFGLALQRFNQIYKHFNDFVDDQLDFHGYATRKQTLRSYRDMIISFSKIRGHPFYAKAAYAAIDLHLAIHEAGPAAEAMIDGVSLGIDY